MLLDAFVTQRTDGRQGFDAGGDLARLGRVDETLLDEMLADDFFAAADSKDDRSRTLRRTISRSNTRGLRALSLEDGAATLSELTAASVAQAIERSGLRNARVFVSGGGARNRTLDGTSGGTAASRTSRTLRCNGIAGRSEGGDGLRGARLRNAARRAGNVPAATGADRPVVLGAIAPQNLRELLARVEGECTASS